jgi:hypothetical protein
VSTVEIAKLVSPPAPMLSVASPSVVESVFEVESWIVSMPAATPMPTWNVIVDPVPSSRLTPLNVVDCAIRSISLTRVRELLMERVAVGVADRAVGRLDRELAEPDQDRADFVERPFPGLGRARCRRSRCARPAAASGPVSASAPRSRAPRRRPLRSRSGDRSTSADS